MAHLVTHRKTNRLLVTTQKKTQNSNIANTKFQIPVHEKEGYNFVEILIVGRWGAPATCSLFLIRQSSSLIMLFGQFGTVSNKVVFRVSVPARCIVAGRVKINKINIIVHDSFIGSGAFIAKQRMHILTILNNI